MFIGITNFTDVMGNFSRWSMQGYTDILGVFVWPVIFVAIIGYVYVKQQSAVAAAVATIMLSAVMVGTSFIAEISPLIQFLQIIVCLTISGLIIYWMARRRGR